MRDQHDGDPYVDAIRDQLRGLSDAEKIAFWEERMRSASPQKSAESNPYWSEKADQLFYVLRFIVVFPIFLGGSLVIWFFATSCVANIIWLPIYLLAYWLSGSPIISAIVGSAVPFTVIVGIAVVGTVSSHRKQKRQNQHYLDVTEPYLARLHIRSAEQLQIDREAYQPPLLREAILPLFGIITLLGLWIGAWTVLMIGNYAKGWLSWWPGP